MSQWLRPGEGLKRLLDAVSVAFSKDEYDDVMLLLDKGFPDLCRHPGSDSTI